MCCTAAQNDEKYCGEKHCEEQKGDANKIGSRREVSFKP